MSLQITSEWDQAFEALGAFFGERVRELEAGASPGSVPDAVADLAGAVFEPAFPGLAEAPAMERITALAALATEVQPHLFEEAVRSVIQRPADYSRVGGVRSELSRLLLPTGETIAFLAGARSSAERLAVLEFFERERPVSGEAVFDLTPPPPGEPVLAGRLCLLPTVLERLLGRARPRPKTGATFPAELVETTMDWDDVVLPETTARQIAELRNWLTHGSTLLRDWGMGRWMRPGYRVLFHGPPGTAKTLTASLLGKSTGRPVYRIDLSLVVSKFIGETEKNLGRIFDQAEDRDWILFFDEADALFGKRTQVRDAHDRYANQEVSFLLQRVETYRGLVILASNFRSNIDEAFLRRFQALIHFPRPGTEDRLRIWERFLPENVEVDPSVDLRALFKRYELSGANIANVIQFTCLRALERGDLRLTAEDLKAGIEREYSKEGRVA